MENHTLKPLFLKKEIQQRTVEVSNKISSDYKGRHPVLIGVLKGSFIFLADIIRQLTIEATIDFVQISSYGASKNSTENCLFKKDLCVDISGRDVLIVEDIIDTGNLNYVSFDISAYSDGLYLYQITVGNTEYNGKLHLVK